MGKLTREQVLQIYNEEGLYKHVAKKYNVSIGCVTHIKTGERNSSITGATAGNSKRQRVKVLTKDKVQQIFEYMRDRDHKRTYQDAVDKFGIPMHTIRRAVIEYAPKKYKLRDQYGKK